MRKVYLIFPKGLSSRPYPICVWSSELDRIYHINSIMYVRGTIEYLRFTYICRLVGENLSSSTPALSYLLLYYAGPMPTKWWPSLRRRWYVHNELSHEKSIQASLWPEKSQITADNIRSPLQALGCQILCWSCTYPMCK